MAVDADPAARVVHVPKCPVEPQDWQPPVQALLQQYPWAQEPLVHCELVVQANPFARVTQIPLVQVCPDAQALPQVPQWLAVVFRLVSQPFEKTPSQSA